MPEGVSTNFGKKVTKDVNVTYVEEPGSPMRLDATFDSSGVGAVRNY